MFYLLPSISNCYKEPDPISDSTQKDPQVRWTKCAVTGLILDICMIAGVCIAASLTLCVHLGVPLSSLNALSGIAIPLMATLWSVAAIYLCADFVKIALLYCAQRKITADDQRAPDPRDGSAGIGIGGETPVPPPNPPSVPQITPTPQGGPSTLGVTPTPPRDVNPTITPETPTLIVGDDEEDWEDVPTPTPQFPQRRVRYLHPDFAELHAASLHDEGEDFEVVIDMPQDPLPAVDEKPQTWFEMGKDLGKKVASGWQTIAGFAAAGTKVSWEHLKTFMKPGSIQMRFYHLHVNYIVEQFLKYDENTHSFHQNHAIPLTYSNKLAQLRNRNFQDPEIQNFKNSIHKIISANHGHPNSTRYYVLWEIEKAYLASNQTASEFRTFLQKLCYQIYTDFDAFTYGEDVINRFLDPQKLSFKNIAAVFEQDQEEIKKLAPEVKGSGLRSMRERFNGTIGAAFYPMITNNFACPLWEEVLNNGTTVKIIRFGTPTDQYAAARVSVLAQMELFIQECQNKNETLLQFQHQADKGVEGQRFAVMKGLCETYPDTFYLFHLDMDSAFYHQTRPDIDKDDKENPLNIDYCTFKISLVDHMKGLFMSENLKAKVNEKIPDYDTKLGEIADEVRSYFSKEERGALSPDLRRAFIFIFYTRFRDFMNERLSPTFSCHQCKDSMDRSVSLAACAFLITAINLGVENDPEFLKYFRTLTSFVGIIVKGSPMHTERYERFLSVLKRLTTGENLPRLPSSVKEQKFGLVSSNHIFSPLPCDATTVDAYLECDLLQDTGENAKYIMPISEGIDLNSLLIHLFQNNALNIGVKGNDKEFQIYLNNKDNIIANGSIFCDNSWVFVQLNRLPQKA